MKRFLVAVLVAGLAVPGAAAINPHPDTMGIYFDQQASCWNLTQVYEPLTVPAFLLLLNPAAATEGFECRIEMPGSSCTILEVDLALDALDVDSSVNGFAVAAPSPFPVVDGAIVLCTFLISISGAGPVGHHQFYLRPAAVPSLPGGMPVVTGNGVLRRCAVSSGDVSVPVAEVNGVCLAWVDGCCDVAVGDERFGFGTVKSLFR